MSNLDLEALSDVQDAIEAAGGKIHDMDTIEHQDTGLEAMVMSAITDTQPTTTHYLLEIEIPGPTSADIPDDLDSGVGGIDALKSIAIAGHWAEEQGHDGLTADLYEVGSRMEAQVDPDGHPVDDLEIDLETDAEDDDT